MFKLKKIDLKKTRLYAMLTYRWIGNHHYYLSNEWLVCDEEPDVEMVKAFFKKHLGYTGVCSLQRFDHNEINDGGFWISGFILEWVNDAEIMEKEWYQRWHTTKDMSEDGRLLADAFPTEEVSR